MMGSDSGSYRLYDNNINKNNNDILVESFILGQKHEGNNTES